MEIRSIQLGPIGTNCYLFWKEGSGSCALVDPGDQGERVLPRLFLSAGRGLFSG